MEEEFSSAVSPDGRFGAVFEADVDAAYLYLLDMAAPEGRQIVSAFRTAKRAAGEADAEVRWSRDGTIAAAMRGASILAVMDLRNAGKDLRRVGRLPEQGDDQLIG
jgi:hypothetical protein